MNNVLDRAVAKLRLDHSEWKLVKFADVAIQQKKSVDREDTHLKHYVKGEHMSSEDLHLQEWGELEDEYLGPAFIRYFEEGDILYGSRRTYLRKVTIAPFEGITSNTTFVIKANEEVIDKRLLPFVMISEGFSQHSIRNSKGSVNPYVNWKDLANYEFLLPPKEQQAEIAELLWAMDEVIQKEQILLANSEKKKRVLFNNKIYVHTLERDKHFGQYKSKFPVHKLDILISQLQYGISDSLSEQAGGTPILRMNNLQDGKLELSNLKYYSFNKGELDKYQLKKGDILFNRTNSYDLVGKVSLFDQDFECSFASYLLRIKTDESRLDSRFLNFFLNSSIGMAKIRKYRTPGVSQSNINAQNLRRIPIPLPSIEFQESLMGEIRLFENAEMNITKSVENSKKLQKSLINQVF